MTFFEWFQHVNDTAIDLDDRYGPQCMDLLHSYCMDVLGLDSSVLRAPTAIQAYQVGNDQYFTKISNLPWNVPKRGDLLFFGAPFGRYIDDKTDKLAYAGHVCVFNEGNVFKFTSIDQNYPINSKVHVQSHGYYPGCLGWLRFKGVPTPIAQK